MTRTIDGDEGFTLIEVLIAMIIIFNLALLTLWLTVIHLLLMQDWGANFNAFMRFVDDVSRATFCT